jgi:hypothetical protein
MECLEPDTLKDVVKSSLCDGFAAVLSFSPDLLRVTTSELLVGNETAGIYHTDTGITVLALRYTFLEGHIVSSWIEFQNLPNDERWQSWYVCPSAENAVACARDTE